MTPEDRWVEFRYRPRSFILGAIPSLAGLAALGLALACMRRAPGTAAAPRRQAASHAAVDAS